MANETKLGVREATRLRELAQKGRPATNVARGATYALRDKGLVEFKDYAVSSTGSGRVTSTGTAVVTAAGHAWIKANPAKAS